MRVIKNLASLFIPNVPIADVPANGLNQLFERLKALYFYDGDRAINYSPYLLLEMCIHSSLYTNMPVGPVVWIGTGTRYADCRRFTTYRVRAEITAIGASGSQIYIEYRAGTAEPWTILPSSAIPLIVVGTFFTARLPLPAGILNSEAYFRLMCSGGNAVADPRLGMVELELSSGDV